MSWPPIPPTESGIGFLDFGVTTIVWGTEGFSQAGTSLSAYIVKTVRPSQRIEELRIENGSGFTDTEILLADGIDYEVTVVDDTKSTTTIPFAGEILTLVTPFLAPFFGQSAPGSGQPPASPPLPFRHFLLVNNSYNAARKQEGERVLLCRSFFLINL